MASYAPWSCMTTSCASAPAAASQRKLCIQGEVTRRGCMIGCNPAPAKDAVKLTACKCVFAESRLKYITARYIAEPLRTSLALKRMPTLIGAPFDV